MHARAALPVLMLFAVLLAACRAEPQAPRFPEADRPVAPIVSDRFSTEDARDRLGEAEEVMAFAGIKAGMSVADIGAGSGWFTVRAAKRVGAKGKVFAVDISEDAIKHINERKQKENLPNIETVLGKEDNPLLPKKKVDAVLILKTYHEIAQPVRLMKNLLPSLRKNALVGVIDRNGDDASHGINRETVVEEMKRAGFFLVEEYDFVKGDGMDYLLIFQAEGRKGK